MLMPDLGCDVDAQFFDVQRRHPGWSFPSMWIARTHVHLHGNTEHDLGSGFLV